MFYTNGLFCNIIANKNYQRFNELSLIHILSVDKTHRQDMLHVREVFLKEIFAGKICKLTELFMNILATKRRESYIEAIAIEFVKQFKEHKKILTAVVTTASGLDESLKKKVMEVIKDGGQSEVELIEKINDKLIGGFTRCV